MQLLHSVGWLPDCAGVSRPRELSCQPVPGKLSGAQPGRMGKALPASQQLPKAGQNRATASSVSSVPSAAARVSGGVRARQLKHSGALVPSGTSAEGAGNNPTSGGHSQGRLRIYAAAIAAAAEAAAVAAAASCAPDDSRGSGSSRLMKGTAAAGALLSAPVNGHDDVRSNAKDTQLSHDDDTGSAPVFAMAHVMGQAAALNPRTALAAPAADGVDAFAADAALADDSAAAVREAGAAAAAASDNSSSTWLCWRSGSGQDSGCDDDVLSCSVTCWHAASPCAQPPVPSSGAAAAAGAVREAGPMQYAYNCGGEDDKAYQYEYEVWGGRNAGAYCQVASETDNGVLFWISPESTHQLAPAGRPQGGNATGGNGGGGGGRIPPPSSPCDLAAWAAAARADASAVAGGAAAAMLAGKGAGGRAGGSSGNMWVEPLDVCYMMRALEPWVCATPGGVLVAPADSAPHEPYCAYPYGQQQQQPPPPPPHVSPLRLGNGGMCGGGGGGGGGDGGHVDSYGLSAADGMGGGGGGVRTAVTVMILGEEAAGAGEEAETEAEADLYVHVLGDSQTGNCVGGAGIGCGCGCAAGVGVMDLLMAPVGGVSAGNVGVVSGASEIISSSASRRGFAWTELFGCTSSNGGGAAAAAPPLQSAPPTAAGSPAAAVTGAAAAAADERCPDAAGVAAEEEGSEFGGAAAAGIVAIDGASEGARAALVAAARGGKVMQVQPVDILRLTLRSNGPSTSSAANYSGGVFTAETETATATSAAAAAAVVPVVPLAARRPPQPLQATAAAAPPPPPPPPPPALCGPGVSVTDAAALAGSADRLGLAMDVHQFYEEEPRHGCRDSGGGGSGGVDSGGCQARGALAVAAVAAAMPPTQQLQQLQSEPLTPQPLTPRPQGSNCVMSVGAVVAAAAQPAVHGAAPRAAPPSALGTLKAEDDDDDAGGSSAAAAAEPPPLDGNGWCQRPRREVRAVSPAGGSAAPMSASAIASAAAGAGASGPTALALPPRSSSAVESARPGGTAGAGWGRWSRGGGGGGGGGSAKGRSSTALTFGRKLQEGLEAALVKLGAVGSRRRLSGDVGGTRDGTSSAAARRV